MYMHILGNAGYLYTRTLIMLCALWTVGDIHGDLRKAIASLEAAQVLQEQQGQVKWSGGDTVVVQLGDVLDRGDSEIGQSGVVHHVASSHMNCSFGGRCVSEKLAYFQHL